MRAVQLDYVKSCPLGAACSSRVTVDDLPDVAHGQCARDVSARLFARNGRRADDLATADRRRRIPSRVYELDPNESAMRVYGRR